MCLGAGSIDSSGYGIGGGHGGWAGGSDPTIVASAGTHYGSYKNPHHKGKTFSNILGLYLSNQ